MARPKLHWGCMERTYTRYWRMIDRYDVAERINNLMLDFGAELNASVAIVERECDKNELETYRRAVGKIMGEMLIEIMNPLYAQHPSLKPDGLK